MGGLDGCGEEEEEEKGEVGEERGAHQTMGLWEDLMDRA